MSNSFWTVNLTEETPRTHEGAEACTLTPEQQLRRSVLACMLWENTFYESGIGIADRIEALVPQVEPEKVASLAIEARGKYKLRSVPLWLAKSMLKTQEHKKFVRTVLERVIQRPDELAKFVEFCGKPLPAQVKKGLARAFTKFNEYQLSKWKSGDNFNLRDVMFLVHPKPKDEDQALIWAKLANKELLAPDTWEVALSAGADKKETFERLLTEKKLGALALLRNLRNMVQSGVNPDLIENALSNINTERILPYRFIAAQRYAPDYTKDLERAMFKCIAGATKLKGKTVLLVDVSGSMDHELSQRSDLLRLDAACGLAMILREVCEDIKIYTFSDDLKKISEARVGFELQKSIINSQSHRCTFLAQSMETLHKSNKDYDRMVVITDEQTHDGIKKPLGKKNYMINVGSYANGVGYGADWIHLDGFSEAIVDWITVSESEDRNGWLQSLLLDFKFE